MDRRFLPDHGGRRLGADRRHFEYAIHIPERRVSGERRSGKDRRFPRAAESEAAHARLN